jgi:hypothetical protein
VTGPTGSTPAIGGSTTQVQYNNAGALAGSANLVWDNTNARLGIGTSSPASKLDVDGVITALGGNSPTGGFNLRNVAGTITPRMTNDAADATVIKTGASGSPIKFNNFANTVENLVCTDSGNLGLGVTPSAWGSNYKAIQIGAQGSLHTYVGVSMAIAANAYDSGVGAWKYIGNNYACRFAQDPSNGQSVWQNAVLGTTNATLTWVNAMSLDASSNLTVTGNVTAYSDERLKKDWTELPINFVENLANVKSGTYTRIDNDIRQAGSSAQDWQALLPEVVLTGEDEAKTLSLAYGNAALVSVIELAKRIVKLEAEVKALKGE